LSYLKKLREERDQLSPKGDAVPGFATPSASTGSIAASAPSTATISTSASSKPPLSQSLKAGFESVKSLDRPNEAIPSGFEKTVKEIEAYQDTIQYQRRKSSREITLTRKTQEELRALKMEREKKEKERKELNTPKIEEPEQDEEY